MAKFAYKMIFFAILSIYLVHATEEAGNCKDKGVLFVWDDSLGPSDWSCDDFAHMLSSVTCGMTLGDFIKSDFQLYSTALEPGITADMLVKELCPNLFRIKCETCAKCEDFQGAIVTIDGDEKTCHTVFSADSIDCESLLLNYLGMVGGVVTFGRGLSAIQSTMPLKDICPETFAEKCTTCARDTLAPTQVPTQHSDEKLENSASAHGDPVIHTFNGDCYDLNKDGLYVASAHPSWGHVVKLAVYNNFIREIQITNKHDDELLFSYSNLNEVTGQWAFGLKQRTRMCQTFTWKHCEFSFPQTEFDAQVFRYYAQIHYHDYADPGLDNGLIGFHLDIYPVVYQKQKADFHAQKDNYSGVYFANPLPEQLEFCPPN